MTQPCTEREQWDADILDLEGHPLQLWGWGDLKAAHNWHVERLIVYDGEAVIGAAQVLIRTLPKPFGSLLYVPRGPSAKDGREADVLDALAGYAREHHRAVTLQIEPDMETLPELKGWKRSKNAILIPRTLVLDLSRTEDELMGAMTKKTRQYIRKSAKEHLEIKRVTGRSEIAKCLAIYHQTAKRAGFSLHDDDYYYDVDKYLGESSVIYASYRGGEVVAFLWLTISGAVAFELYGGMNEAGQQLRANYALKWHAITRCKEWGIAKYDMNGLLNDGVSTFKQGFADHETMLIGTYDFPLSSLYTAWTTLLPAGKKIARRLRR